jgi:hypothetical protein
MVKFIEDVEWGGLHLQDCEDQRYHDNRFLTSG